MKTLYYAVNGTGQGIVFISRPIRDDTKKIWLGDIVPCYMLAVTQMVSEGLFDLPLMKWSDEPVKLTLKIDVC